jgi:hypothetical protein
MAFRGREVNMVSKNMVLIFRHSLHETVKATRAEAVAWFLIRDMEVIL